MASKYFKGIKVKDKVFDLFENRMMVVDFIATGVYFPIYLRTQKGNNTNSCTMNGFDGVHRTKRFYWGKPIVVDDYKKKWEHQDLLKNK